MLNQKSNQNKIPANSIRLQKSNSEANHTYKKINRDSNNYLAMKKYKIPREKIINNDNYNNNNRNIKPKPKFLLNSHHHISSYSSPFCIICGSIFYKAPDSNKIIESIKPNNYFYNP